jgi:UDP-GlcNAc:undecaprenyl-phosphate GlcNAc-1-phosphate transferase
MMNYLLIAISGLLLGFIFVRGALLIFPRIGLLDKPDKYGLKRLPIPYYGGIAIVLAFLLGVLFWLKIDQKLLVFLGLGLFVSIVSFIDDRSGVSPILRLLMQILVGIGLFAGGIYVQAFPNPLGAELLLTSFNLGGFAVISLLVTVLWVVLVMNTVNWIDGLNGLPSGVGGIAALTIFFLSIKPGLHSIDQTAVATMALLLAMILLVFWWHDFYPAKILMGDTGSMFLGFVLAGLSIYSGGKLATAFLVLGLPILDALWVILRRIMSGKSPFKGDLDHFHHRLLRAGLTIRQSLIAIYLISSVFGILAIFLGSGQKIWAIIGLMAVMATIGLSVVILEVEKKRKKV